MLPAHKIKFLVAQLLGTAIFLFAGAASTGRRPSLDDLVVRAGTYWGLLANGQKDRALEYVQPLSRANYLDRQTPAFSEPRVTGLELSPALAEVWVTVKVRRVLPMIPTPVDWPVKEKWVFEGGKWLVVIAKSPDKFARVTLTEPRAAATNLEQEEEEKRQSIRETLHFENSKIDFGTVRQGQQIPVELKYQLTGREAMAWRLEGTPRELSGVSTKELTPGEGQKIDLSLATEELDGEVSETFTVLAGHSGLEVPYEFSIHGYVYTPVSISPRAVRFLRAESGKEIALRNNSKSTIQIMPVEEAAFDVQPLPQTIAPGAECRLSVRLKFKGYETNHGSEITFRFAEPIDGVESVALPVIVNFEPPKAWQRPPWELPVPSPKPPR